MNMLGLNVCVCLLLRRYLPAVLSQGGAREVHLGAAPGDATAQEGGAAAELPAAGIRTHAEIDQYDRDLKSRQDELRSRYAARPMRSVRHGVLGRAGRKSLGDARSAYVHVVLVLRVSPMAGDARVGVR